MQKLEADNDFEVPETLNEEELELKEMKAIRNKKWNDSDLV